MKASHLASILFLATATTFACNDDDDAATTGGAGKGSVAGTSGDSGSGGKGGTGNDGGSAALGGEGGGPAHAGGKGGTGNDGGSAGLVGGAESAPPGGEGGSPTHAGGVPAAGGALTSDGGAGLGGAGIDGETGGGAAGAAGEPNQAPLEILGTWNNNFGGTDVISATQWGTARIAAYDNRANAVYTQLPADDLYNPSKFTKIVYTEPTNDSFYYCWVVYSASTLAEAKTTTLTADASDPENGGCGGFSWTKATKSP